MVLLKYFRPAVPTNKQKKALTEREVQEANAHVKDRQLSAPSPTRLTSLSSATANRLDSFAHM